MDIASGSTRIIWHLQRMKPGLTPWSFLLADQSTIDVGIRRGTYRQSTRCCIACPRARAYIQENVPDLRNSKVAAWCVIFRQKVTRCRYTTRWRMRKKLVSFGITLLPEFPSDFDCVIGCVAHNYYRAFDFGFTLKAGGLIADLKGMWRESEARQRFRYWSL